MASPGDRNAVPELARAAQARRPARVLQRGHRPPDRRAELHAGRLVGRHLGDGQLAADVRPALRDRWGAAAHRLHRQAGHPHLGASPVGAFAWRCSRSTSASRWPALCISKMLCCSRDPELHKEIQSSMGVRDLPDRGILGSGRVGPALREPLPGSRRPRGWPAGPGATVSTWAAGPGTRRSRCRTSRRPRRSTPCFTSGGASFPTRAAPGSTAAATRWSWRWCRTASTPIPHHTASAAHHAVPMAPLFGGYPSNVNRFILQRDTDVLDLLGGRHRARAGPSAGRQRGGARAQGLRRAAEPRRTSTCSAGAAPVATAIRWIAIPRWWPATWRVASSAGTRRSGSTA